FRAARDLLPVYNFLGSGASSTPLKEETNGLITALNNACPKEGCDYGPTQFISNFVLSAADIFSDAVEKSKVEARIFYSNQDQTLSTIVVGYPLSTGDLYKDGAPLGADPNGYFVGDGTVLSTDIDYGLAITKVVADGEVPHAGLINYFTSQLVKYVQSDSVSENSAGKQLSVKDASPFRAIVITTQGLVQPSLVVSNGDPQDIEVATSFDIGTVGVSNPTNGQYTLQLIQSSDNTDYYFTVFYVDYANNISVEQDFHNGGDAGATKNLTFSVDITTPTVFTFGRLFNAPTDVSLYNTGGVVQVAWNDPTGDAAKDVDHYAVYYKLPTQPYYQLLGATEDNTHYLDATQPWSESQGSSYVVKAFLKDGTSTVYSDEVTNNG
ncbi:MAG: hypothetical protein K5Q00_00590, partial [Gammaproteobacteria bacterium]|nr:hypothetical protein [Gammaproteobacteria bacterium]